jgi:hypothetical protein
VLLTPRLAQAKSEQIQLFCDCLGKWLLAQVFALIVQEVVFRYHIEINSAGAMNGSSIANAQMGMDGSEAYGAPPPSSR